MATLYPNLQTPTESVILVRGSTNRGTGTEYVYSTTSVNEVLKLIMDSPVRQILFDVVDLHRGIEVLKRQTEIEQAKAQAKAEA